MSPSAIVDLIGTCLAVLIVAAILTAAGVGAACWYAADWVMRRWW